MSKPISQQYVIESAIITSDFKTGGSDDIIDVTSVIVELKLIESMMKPYITGQVLIVDQNDVFRKMHVVGSHRLTVTFSPAKDNNIPSITHTFVMLRQDAVVNNDTFVFSLIEEHGYIATTKIIAEAYTGSLLNIVLKIGQSKLNKEIKALYTKDAEEPSIVKQRAHVVIPNINAWEAINWVVDRMSTATGSPYFISGSLYRNGIALWSLEEALNSTAVNIDVPFLRSDIFRQKTGAELNNTPEGEAAIIQYQDNFTNSMHMLDKTMSLAGIHDLIDTNTNIVSPVSYSLGGTLEGMEKAGVIKQQRVVDHWFSIDDKQISATSSAYIAQATSSGTYLKAASYADDDTKATTATKLSNRMLKNVMNQNNISAVVPGKLVAAYQMAVGQKVRMNFENSNRPGDYSKIKMDVKLSGDYIITRLTHHFSGLEYNVTIDGIKFHEDSIERVV